MRSQASLVALASVDLHLRSANMPLPLPACRMMQTFMQTLAKQASGEVPQVTLELVEASHVEAQLHETCTTHNTSALSMLLLQAPTGAAAAEAACAAQSLEPELGLVSRQASALQRRVCPSAASEAQLSLCHVQDARSDHSCMQAAHCGVDATTCTPRTCSSYGYCQ